MSKTNLDGCCARRLLLTSNIYGWDGGVERRASATMYAFVVVTE